MTNKQQFILALVFIISFSLISGFIFIYGTINDITLWQAYQPYFEKILVAVSAVGGYYTRMWVSGQTNVVENEN